MGMLNHLTGWHALVIFAVIVLLFGATKLPTLAKSVGQSIKILKTEMRTEQSRASADDEPDASAVPVSTDTSVPLTPARSSGV